MTPLPRPAPGSIWALAAAATLASAAGCSSDLTGDHFPPDGGTGGSCQVVLHLVSPAPPADVVPGPTAKARIRGEITGTIGGATTWTWTATSGAGAALDVVHPVDDMALVDVPIAAYGNYTVSAAVTDGTRRCSGAIAVVAKPPGARMAFYTFQLRPPAGSFPAKQTAAVPIYGGTPDDTANLQLESGTPVALRPRHASDSAPLAAYVRVTEATSGLFQEGHAAADGSPATFKLPAAGSYDVLVVPDGAVPPLLIKGKRADELATLGAVMLDDGVAVAGRVLDAAGAPVASARLSLRAGALPSTVGQSAADGSFSLRTRPGTYAATVVPGPALPGWELSVPVAPGVVIPQAATAATTVTVRLAALPTARIGLAMTGARSGSKVLLETRAPLTGAAVLETGGASLPAAARVRVEASVDAAGAATIAAVPRAHYRATLFAAGAPATADVAAAPASITSIDDIDATTGDVTRTMAVAPAVTIDGTLLPSAGAQDARVLAIDEGARLAVAPEAAATFLVAASAQGTFSLRVNPSRVYRMIVDPPPGGAFARLTLPAVTVATASVTVPAQTLPTGLAYGGHVIDPLLQPVAGVTVSAHCVAGTAGCTDPDSAVAEAVTGADGAFRLTLPDPGATGP